MQQFFSLLSWRLFTALHVSGLQAHLQESSHSCSHNHWFSICTVQVACTRPEWYRYWTNGCMNSCVSSPEDGPVGPKHVEIRRYMNKIEIVTSVGFSFHIHRCTNFSNLFLEWNSACFGQFLCPSSGVFHCIHSNGICHTGLLTDCEQEHSLLLASSNPGGGEIFRTCPERPWGPPSLLYIGYRVFPGIKSGQGVTLTPHPLLVPWSRKGRTVPLLPLWAVRPVQSLSACTRVHFTFIFTLKKLHAVEEGLRSLEFVR